MFEKNCHVNATFDSRFSNHYARFACNIMPTPMEAGCCLPKYDFLKRSTRKLSYRKVNTSTPIFPLENRVRWAARALATPMDSLRKSVKR